jgi:hypothetical protein
MHFVSGNVGPCCLTAKERKLNRMDGTTGKKIKQLRNEPDLQTALEAKGVAAKGTKDELRVLSKNKDTPVKEEIDDATEGQEGKGKQRGCCKSFGRRASLIRAS